MGFDNNKELEQVESAPYKAVVFHLVDVKTMTEQTLDDAVFKSIKTFNHITRTIKILEKVYGQPILINKKPIKLVNDISKPKNQDDLYLNNPTIINDSSFIFYFYNDNPLRQDIKELFYSSAKKFDNDYAYHILEGNFYNFNIKEQFDKYWLNHVAEQLSNTKQEKIQYKKDELTM